MFKPGDLVKIIESNNQSLIGQLAIVYKIDSFIWVKYFKFNLGCIGRFTFPSSLKLLNSVVDS